MVTLINSLSLLFVIKRKNMIDETLWRIYFGNCKTHLTTRAGLHHRRIMFFRNGLIFLGSYPSSYSPLSTETVSKRNLTEQSINLGGFFSLCKLHNTLTLKHSFVPSRENKRGGRSCFQLFVNEFVCWYHRLRCLFYRMLAHSRNVLTQQSLQVFPQPFLFASQKSIKRLEFAYCAPVYMSSQLFNAGCLFLLPSTHSNNCGLYFYVLEIVKEFCLYLRCWPHPKYTCTCSTQGNTSIYFLDHLSGLFENLSCKYLLRVTSVLCNLCSSTVRHSMHGHSSSAITSDNVRRYE